MKKAIYFIIGILLVVVVLLSCSLCSFKEPDKITIFSSNISGYVDKEGKILKKDIMPFGSYISFIEYNGDKANNLKSLLDEKVFAYHSLLDNKFYYKNNKGEIINNIKVINDSYGSGQNIAVDQIVVDVLKEGIRYSKLSNGYFNIVAGAVVDLWENSLVSSKKDPSEEEVLNMMKCVPSVDMIDEILIINDEENTVKFNGISGCEGKASITLGAMGKSLFIDKLAYMEEFKNIEPSIYDAGQSSIIINGDNPNKSDGLWYIGIKDSVNSTALLNEELVKIKVNGGKAISTSGDVYKGYINDNGEVRHHIIDGLSGYPNDFVVGCTVVGDSAMVMDVISTTLMTMDSIEEIKEYLDVLENNDIDVDVLLQVLENETLKVYVTKSMADRVSGIKEGTEMVEISYED